MVVVPWRDCLSSMKSQLRRRNGLLLRSRQLRSLPLRATVLVMGLQMKSCDIPVLVNFELIYGIDVVLVCFGDVRLWVRFTLGYVAWHVDGSL